MKTDWDKWATEDELPILHGPCAGERCWWNSETGYREYCSTHEAVIADIVDRIEADLRTPPPDQGADAQESK